MEEEKLQETCAEGEGASAAVQAEPLVRAHLTLDGKLYKRLYGKWGIAMCILGGFAVVLFALWVAASVIKDGGTFSEVFSNVLYLWAAAILFACAAVYLFCTAKLCRDADANVRENTYLFYEREFTIETSRRGEQVGVTRFSYAECGKIAERKAFFLLKVPAAGTVVVEKGGLSQEDCAQLRALFGLASK